MERPTHDKVCMELAEVISRRSRDPSTKVGCVISRPNRTIASAGYNGFPRGVHDSDERYADRETKYLFTCHAEANAITTAREPLEGYTLYCTHPPCCECAKLIIQSGINKVVTPPADKEFSDRWDKQLQAMMVMFTEAGVTVRTPNADREAQSR